MPSELSLQELCERGQERLIATDYIGAEAALVKADHLATRAGDFDTLSRLYLPLQEARRQRRQRCGEGIVCLDRIARSAEDRIDPEAIASRFAHGQLLVAGWGSAQPAADLRATQSAHNQYAETLLAASYPTTAGLAVILVPLADVALPPIDPQRSIEQLRSSIASYCTILKADDLPAGEQRGDWRTFARVQALWEQLHAPFLAAADMGTRAENKIEGYRRTIDVDYACELAHQRLSAAAHELARTR